VFAGRRTALVSLLIARGELDEGELQALRKVLEKKG